MSMIECVIAVQTSSGDMPLNSHTTLAQYLAIAVVAVVLGLVVVVFIRSGRRRSSKRQG